MIYKKTHTSKNALNDHLSKIKERGLAYKVTGMTIEYGTVEKSKNNSIQGKTSTDLIMEAAKKGYRKVEVIFAKIKLSDFPKNTHNSASVKAVVGTQKKETFDVSEDTLDIIKLLKNKDVQSIKFK